MSGTETAKSAARAAAEWWAEQVGSPVQRLVSDDQRDFSSDFAELSLMRLAANNPIPTGAGLVFAADLEKRIAERLEHSDSASMGVDYGPDIILRDAAAVAGISASRFPIKTHMWVYADHVTASLGYRGPTRLVWQAPDWDRPTCQSLAYTESTGIFGDDRCTLPRFHDGDHGDWKPDPRRCKGCGLTNGGHYNRTDKGDYHSFADVTS